MGIEERKKFRIHFNINLSYGLEWNDKKGKVMY